MARGWRGRKDDDENDAEEERARVWDAKTTRRAGVDTARRRQRQGCESKMRRIPSDPRTESSLSADLESSLNTLEHLRNPEVHDVIIVVIRWLLLLLLATEHDDSITEKCT